MSRRVIPYGHQTIDEGDVRAVTDALRGEWLTQGPTVERFEASFAEYVGASHAVSFSSGTAGLHGAAATAGIGPGDLVVTSALTFIASANCARYVGADVGLVDIDSATLNMDVTAVPEGADAIVAVHYAGLPVDLQRLRHRPRVVIEDAAHALGASTPDGRVGNCARSDLCVFSLHPVKAMTTGEGGMVTTNDDDVADALRRFRSHGIVRTPRGEAWRYDVGSIGFNYRMTDIQAALGLSQLSKLDRFLIRRNEIADRYRSLLEGTPVVCPPLARDGVTHAYHLFPIQVANRRRVFDGLRAVGIGVQVHYVPIHHHAVNADLGLKPGDLVVCDDVYGRLISLPLYPGMTDEDQDYVVASLQRLIA